MVVDKETLVLTADPRGAEPSDIPGASIAELEAMLENIRWFSRLSLGRKLAVSALHSRRASRLAQRTENDGG